MQGERIKSTDFVVDRLNRQLKRKECELKSKNKIVEELTGKVHSLEAQNLRLLEHLEALNKPADGYRKEWTWVRKIVFVLEQSGQPLRSPDIIEALAKREEHLRNHWNQAQYFSAFLDMALKAERIKREKRKGERGYYYSLI